MHFPTIAGSTFGAEFNMTFIGTATAVLTINGVNLLTDPFFSPAGTRFENPDGSITINSGGPALDLKDLPVIDAVLLSHEGHFDNLDPIGRGMLDGRRVLTTMDGAQALAPRPGVQGLKPWETINVQIGGTTFDITGTPCNHGVFGGEVTGFIIREPSFGETAGLPNAIWYSGDTLYIPELVQMREKFHVSAAIVNLGNARAPVTNSTEKVTMSGMDAARLLREIDADVLVPMHFDDWPHFRETGGQLAEVFKEVGVEDKVRWLTPGISMRVL